jgi:hypothetical protein
LIPALHHGAYRAGHDSQEKDAGDSPFVKNLIAQGVYLRLVQGLGSGNVLVAGRISRDECALADDQAPFLQLLVAAELFDSQKQTSGRYPGEGVLDPDVSVSAMELGSNSNWGDKAWYRNLPRLKIGVEVDLGPVAKVPTLWRGRWWTTTPGPSADGAHNIRIKDVKGPGEGVAYDSKSSISSTPSAEIVAMAAQERCGREGPWRFPAPSMSLTIQDEDGLRSSLESRETTRLSVGPRLALLWQDQALSAPAIDGGRPSCHHELQFRVSA